MNRIVWIIAASVVVSVSGSHNQDTQFRAGTQRIVVDVVVTDRKGKAVRDLACEDFALRDNGVPQKLTTCDFLAKTTAGVRRNENSETSARASDFRPLLIVIDDYNLPQSRVALVRDHVQRFVQQKLGDDDIVGLYYAGESASDGRLTVDREAIVSKLMTIRSWLVNAAPPRTGEHVLRRSANSPDKNVRRRDRARLLLHTIRSTSSAVGSQRMRRGRVVLVSPGFPFQYSKGEETILPELRDTVVLANRNDLMIHVVDPSGLRGIEMGLDLPGGPSGGAAARTHASSLSGDFDTLSLLTVETGGLLLLNRNDLLEGLLIARAAGEERYVLTYDTAWPADGAYHTIDVEVKDCECHVRARRGYLAR